MSTIKKQQFGITTLTSQHKDIRQLKRNYPTSIHGNKIWKSSLLLMHYFQHNPIPEHWHVLELGCGWGLTSIYLNKTFGCHITAVDADENVEPYLRLHEKVNGCHITFWPKYFENITQEELSQFDLIVAADVCFWDELEDIHYHLIETAVEAGVKKIVYADPIRSPFEALASRCSDDYFAEVEELELDKPNQARGALMVIENE